jgi:hypothetical protein
MESPATPPRFLIEREIAQVWRDQNGRFSPRPDLFQVDLGKPLVLPPGEYAVVGDIQAPTTNYDFFTLFLAMSKQELKRPRTCILAGDLLNADSHSLYPALEPLPSWRTETTATEHLLDSLLTVFERVVWFFGNHENRVLARSNGVISPDMVLGMVTRDPKILKRVDVSGWGHCVVLNDNGANWRITHGSAYSINQLNVADQMAQKYQAHILSHHQHHLAVGWDRYKRYMVVDNGGLFDQVQMAYVVKQDSKMGNMIPGFTLLKHGYPQVYGPEPFTDWRRTLKVKRNVVLGAPSE